MEESIPIEQAINREKLNEFSGRKEIINSYFRGCVCIQYSMSYISTLNIMVNIFLCTEKGIGRFQLKVHSNIKLPVVFYSHVFYLCIRVKRFLLQFFFWLSHITHSSGVREGI